MAQWWWRGALLRAPGTGERASTQRGQHCRTHSCCCPRSRFGGGTPTHPGRRGRRVREGEEHGHRLAVAVQHVRHLLLRLWLCRRCCWPVATARGEGRLWRGGPRHPSTWAGRPRAEGRERGEGGRVELRRFVRPEQLVLRHAVSGRRNAHREVPGREKVAHHSCAGCYCEGCCWGVNCAYGLSRCGLWRSARADGVVMVRDEVVPVVARSVGKILPKPRERATSWSHERRVGSQGHFLHCWARCSRGMR